MEAVVKGLQARKKWIDIYRGIAILLVVLGHLDVPRSLYNFIFVFHMYAFFFISGVTYKANNSSYKAIVIKNIKRLLIPYIIYAYMWDITSFAIRLYLHTQGNITLQSVLRNLFSVIIGGGVIESTADIGTAWFLYSMFFVRIIYEGLYRLTKDKRLIGLACCMLFTLGYVLNGFSSMPFCLIPSFTSILFFFIGDCSKEILTKLNDWIKKKQYGVWVAIALSFISFIIVLICSKQSTEALLLLKNSLPYSAHVLIIGAISGIFGLVFIAIVIEQQHYLTKILTFFGVNSLIVMGLHSEIHMVFSLIFQGKFGISGDLLVIPIFVGTLALFVPICGIAKKVQERIKIPLL